MAAQHTPHKALFSGGVGWLGPRTWVKLQRITSWISHPQDAGHKWRVFFSGGDPLWNANISQKGECYWGSFIGNVRPWYNLGIFPLLASKSRLPWLAASGEFVHVSCHFYHHTKRRHDSQLTNGDAFLHQLRGGPTNHQLQGGPLLVISYT